MKYIVISCGEREIELEAVCDTYAAAYEKMKECFLEYHRDYGYSEEELEELKVEIESEPDLETSYYGFHSGGCSFAWSNVDDNYNFDIKIFEIK